MRPHGVAALVASKSGFRVLAVLAAAILAAESYVESLATEYY
tara:strand:+ start:676 stop:801 length:126 start_codon:yes stop_codon:yes gene_type:complete